MDTMFEKLLQLPLLQGLSYDDFTNIVGRVRLHFEKYKPGEKIVNAGDKCNKLLFILNGELARTTTSADASYSLTEYFQAPYLIEPYALFGLKTHFASGYAATSEVHSFSIDKLVILNDLSRHDIFRLNYINLLCSKAQMQAGRNWKEPINGLEARITNFVLTHSDRPAGKKLLKIKMNTLAQLLNDTRSAISKALNAMEQKGVLELSRGEILIPDAAKLLP